MTQAVASKTDRFDMIVVGPRGVGKSSVCEHITRAYARPTFSVDAHCFELYLGDERFREAARRVGAKPSFEDIGRVFTEVARDPALDCLAFQEEIHLMAVRAILATAPARIIDFGSGHCSYAIAENQHQLCELLAPHPVLCLWPSPSRERAARILAARNGRSLSETEEALARNRAREAAGAVIYAEHRTVAALADEAFDWMCNPDRLKEGTNHGSRYTRTAFSTAIIHRVDTKHHACGP